MENDTLTEKKSKKKQLENEYLNEKVNKKKKLDTAMWFMLFLIVIYLIILTRIAR